MLERPDPEALPSWRLKVILPLALGIIATAAVVAWSGWIDRAAQVNEWTARLAAQLADSRSEFWQQPADHQPHSGWLFFQGSGADLDVLERVALPPGFTPARGRLRIDRLDRAISGDYYLIRLAGRWPVFFAAEYSIVVSDRRLVAGEYSPSPSLLLRPWASRSILLLFLLVPAVDRVLITMHRRKQSRIYAEYERERTREVYQARELAAKARLLADNGDLAKALVSVNEALAALPEYPEALELHRLIRGLMAEDASLLPVRFAPVVAGVDETVYLRVVGTPYAYRAPAAASTIRVGRQRPQGESDPQGNDLVVRIPASGDRSLRISRHHFEINRIGREYFVVDHSGGQTRLNGAVLEKGQPAKVVTGDRLLIADVMALELSIRPSLARSPAEVLRLGAEVGRFNFEATVGDMLTEV